MNDAIVIMLGRYHCVGINDYENALKEIIQEIALLGLWRAKFFENAAFYGGSALRIMHGLNRFSEDLDFSLLKPDQKFSLAPYSRAVEAELKSFGFSVEVTSKVQTTQTNIDSAFIKAGTLKNMIVIDIPEALRRKIHKWKLIKVKFEVDKDPPGGFLTETKYLFEPIPFAVNTYTLPCIFAGKLHALLCRQWTGRVKGRDWYDLVWFIGKNVPVDLRHMERRMRQTGNLSREEGLSEESLKRKLFDKIGKVDFAAARRDVENFVKDPVSLKLWGPDYFKSVCERIIVEEKEGDD